MAITRQAIDDLSRKYEEILRLRIAHASPSEPDPRRDMAQLASRFPGALREIDELSLEDIRARLRALTLAADEPSSASSWMIAVARFHELARGALSAKRWLAGRKVVDDVTRSAFLLDLATLPWPREARDWADDLHRVAAPPRGRVTDLVYERIARDLGVTLAEARVLVFGISRRERRAKRA
jgi:hypothetical protein